MIPIFSVELALLWEDVFGLLGRLSLCICILTVTFVVGRHFVNLLYLGGPYRGSPNCGSLMTYKCPTRSFVLLINVYLWNIHTIFRITWY